MASYDGNSESDLWTLDRADGKYTLTERKVGQSNSAESTTSNDQVQGLHNKIRQHADPLEQCRDIYKQISSKITQSEEGESTAFDPVITTILKNQLRNNSTLTLKEMVAMREKELESGKELRVLVAGALGAGKTTFLNLLIGEELLPAFNGNTTQVQCEIRNSPERCAYLYLESNTEKQKIILLKINKKGTKEWEILEETIRKSTYEGKEVRKIEIRWPLSALTDKDQTPPMKLLMDEDRDDPYFDLPFVFLDLPGFNITSGDGIHFLSQNIPKYQKFIFVLDAFAGQRQYLAEQTHLMQSISTSIEGVGAEFDPQSVLFLLNKMDQVSLPPGSDPIKTQVLTEINRVWPSVRESQLIEVSCKQQLKDHIDIEFQKKICKFLEDANYSKLEEHCRWLIDFLETTFAFLEQGKEWQPTEVRLKELKVHAQSDKDYLDAIDLSKLDKELKVYAEHSADVLKGNMIKRLDEKFKQKRLNENDLVDLKKQLRQLISSEENKRVIREFDENVKSARNKFRNEVRKEMKLKDVFDKEYKGSDDIELLIAYGVAAILSIPVASLILLVLSAKDEINDLLDGNPRRHISKHAEYFQNKVQTILKSERSFIREQIKKRSQIYLSNVKDMNIQREGYMEEILNLQNKVWSIYICNLKHNYQMADLEPHIDKLGRGGNGLVWSVSVTTGDGQKEYVAKKVVEARLRIAQSQTEKPDHSSSLSLPDSFDIYRECLILRELSKKGNENFVAFKGSAYCTNYENNTYQLAILMELCKCSLKDVIQNLVYENISDDWVRNNREKMLHYCLGAAKGLLFLHENGIIHRDVKSANFLIKAGSSWTDDVVKICDVGHSKGYDRVCTIGRRGTKMYLAPEVQHDEQYHTKWSDVYSFGLLLWEMWYQQRLPKEYAGKLPPMDPRPDLTEFRKLLNSCLDRSPTKRPEMVEVVEILAKLK